MSRGNHVRPDGGVEPAFSGLLARLAMAYGTSLSEQRIRIYADVLGDVPFRELAEAIGRAANTFRYFPSIAEIRQALRPATDEAALVAWAGLQRAAAEVGAYATLDVEDGAAAYALAHVFGTWPEFCACPDGPSLAARRHEFVAAYKSASARGTASRRLVGLCAPGAPEDERVRVTWGARLLADGAIVPERERPRLAPPALPEKGDG